MLWTLRNVLNIKVPFFSSCTHFSVFSCAIHAAQLVRCMLYFYLKIFPGSAFSAQKLQVEKCCRHYTMCMLDFSVIQTVGDNYLFLINSELDSDNSLLNTKLLLIDLANVNGKK